MSNEQNTPANRPQILKLSRKSLKKIVGGRSEGDEPVFVASRCPGKVRPVAIDLD